MPRGTRARATEETCSNAFAVPYLLRQTAATHDTTLFTRIRVCTWWDMHAWYWNWYRIDRCLHCPSRASSSSSSSSCMSWGVRRWPVTRPHGQARATAAACRCFQALLSCSTLQFTVLLLATGAVVSFFLFLLTDVRPHADADAAVRVRFRFRSKQSKLGVLYCTG